MKNMKEADSCKMSDRCWVAVLSVKWGTTHAEVGASMQVDNCNSFLYYLGPTQPDLTTNSRELEKTYIIF